MTAIPPSLEAEIWLHILHPDRKLSARVANAFLKLSFPEGDLARMHDLSAKARKGTLTADEDAEMDGYERVGTLLSTLKSKARQVLKRPRATAST